MQGLIEEARALGISLYRELIIKLPENTSVKSFLEDVAFNLKTNAEDASIWADIEYEDNYPLACIYMCQTVEKSAEELEVEIAARKKAKVDEQERELRLLEDLRKKYPNK